MPTQLVEKRRPAGGTRGRRLGDGRRGPGPGGRGPGFRGDGAMPAREAAPLNTGLLGVAALLAAVAMLFIAFTTAYVAQQQQAGWPPLAMPAVLWLNTAILLASSGTLEWARARVRRGDLLGLRRGVEATAILGAAFVLGQLAAWRQLAAQGIFLASNPHSAFFYLLSGAHGLHLLGGVVALGVVLARAWRGRYTAGRHEGLTACATYWHFMDLLWLYLFALLFWV